MKKKLRDLTIKDYERYEHEVCSVVNQSGDKTSDKCRWCPLRYVNCNIDDRACWIYHDELYSDAFLDSEIEIGGDLSSQIVELYRRLSHESI